MSIKGLLLPVFSLPNKYGIGDFGNECFKFIALLKKSGFNTWQILPLNPISYGHSPYQPYSSYAIEELYISLDEFIKEGLLDKVPSFRRNKNHVDYEKVRLFKEPFYEKAFNNYLNKYGEEALIIFAKDNLKIDQYANFMTLKEFNNGLSFDKWDKNLCIDEKSFHEKYLYYLFKQYYALKQWNNVHEFAKKNNITIVGDIPFYVGYDSSDVYFNKQYFLLDSNDNMIFVAGVSPDYFSSLGQRWGNPIYNFDELRKENFSFLIDRIIYACTLYDRVRIDHFRAFDTYYVIPSDKLDARIGEWRYAPGYEIFDRLFFIKPDIDIIAEDLGNLRDEVYYLRDHYHFPGMNVLQFTIDTFLNRNIIDFDGFNNVITYIGTHDNETLTGFISKMKMSYKTKLKKYFNSLNIHSNNLNDMFLKFAFRNFDNVIISFVDMLGVNNHGRINIPSVVNDTNWTYKLSNFDKLKYYMKKEY